MSEYRVGWIQNKKAIVSMLNIAEVVRVGDTFNLNKILYDDEVKLCSIHSMISLKTNIVYFLNV